MSRIRLKSGTAVATAATAATMAAFALGAAVGSRRAAALERNKRRAAARESENDGDLRDDARPTRNGRDAPHPRTSSSPSDATVSDGALDCAVCLGELVLPRVAPCGHSLCTGCLAALWTHERRPACPVCRKRIRVSHLTELPVNFAARAVIESRARASGPVALAALRVAEDEARTHVRCPHDTTQSAPTRPRQPVLRQLRPAWNWFKWTAIIVTEFGAFLVSLKEVLEATPSRTRRYQRIV